MRLKKKKIFVFFLISKFVISRIQTILLFMNKKKKKRLVSNYYNKLKTKCSQYTRFAKIKFMLMI